MTSKCRAVIGPTFPKVLEALERQGFFCSAICHWAPRSAFAARWWL